MNKFITLMAVLRRKAYLPAVALLALMSGLAAKADVVIDATNFPDETFRNWVLSQTYGADGVLTDAEIANVISISVINKNISSLKGIEYFTALKELRCYNNQLTSLDISKNTALIYLDCHTNLLTSLDVSNNTALETFWCPRNQLTSLDVSKNTALRILECFYNQLTELDVSNNTALEWLYCQYNQLKSLDLSKNTKLTTLVCDDNHLTSLDLSNNTALNYLWCGKNQLTELDLSNNTAFTSEDWLVYRGQTRTLTAESAVTPEGERFYYLRLNNNVNGVKSIVERMTETNFGGEVSKFDPSRVLSWTSGGTVSGGILLLTDVTEDPTTNTASGTVKYKYNINNSRDPDGQWGDFTLNWTAPMPEGSTSGPAALELNKKGIRLQLTQSQQLEVVTPDAGEITWTSDNPEVVEVDSTGRVTALKNGIAIITATAANGSSTCCCVVSYLLGDLNEDNKVDVSDLNEELNIILTQ